MMRAALALAVLLGAVSPAAAGEDHSRLVDLKDFTAIEVSGAYELDVTVGDDYRVELTGSEDEVARADVTVKDGALVLGAKKKLRKVKHDHEHTLRAVVNMPALDRVSVSGVTDADIRGVDAGDFKVNLSGVGDVTIEGRCGNLHARVSGVGELNAQDFRCAVVDVALSGMGEASVYARETAKAEVSGMGEIGIYGSPKTVDKRGGFFSEITIH
jgi:hypothetical protein